jgi:glycosyltransferase involved in cell wall biosynthesis
MPEKLSGDYFLCVSRIEPNKHLEIAIQAANMLHTKLKIVGISNTPWYEKKLHAAAGATIEFLGHKSDADIAKLYAKSIAFIFPSKSEDFGIAPLEATAHGVPVIAYRGGGARETIVEGVTGTFFYAHTPKSLVQQMKRIRTMHFSPKMLYLHAKQFSEERFRKNIMNYISQLPLKIVPDKE